MKICVDVLCIGASSWDLVCSVPYHPRADEKMLANNLIMCGGGPASNAAVAVSRLGLESAFIGRLGRDVWGDMHLQELQANRVCTDFLLRTDSATP